MNGDGHTWLVLGGLTLIAVAVAAAIALYRDSRRSRDGATDDSPTVPEDAMR
jgi:hypothetical protein